MVHGRHIGVHWRASKEKTRNSICITIPFRIYYPNLFNFESFTNFVLDRVSNVR